MDIVNFLEEYKVDYQRDVCLSAITGMNIDGSVPILAKPDSIEKLSLLYRFLCKEAYSYEVIGCLSNTFICSSFRRDIVIQTSKVKEKKQFEDKLTIGCGYSLTKIAKELSDAGLVGFEGFIGIPGTIGAAAINNSGAFTSVMSDVVSSVEIVDRQGRILSLRNQDLQYETRSSVLKNNNFGVLLSVTLNTERFGDVYEIAQRINRYSKIRNRDIDGKRKSLGSIIVGNTLPLLWNEHKIANVIRKFLYAPFRFTPYRKKAQCITEFLVLGGLRFVKHCDNIGRFCWTKETTEDDFMEYIEFIKAKSNDKVTLEIEIKK